MKSILIADDSVPGRKVLRVFLERIGYAICAEAVNGVDAVDKASELKPDLIVLDLSMPRLNGIEVSKVLKGRLPHTPIVLFTMYDVTPSVASAAGVSSVVQKSDGINELAECIQTLLPPQPTSGQKEAERQFQLTPRLRA